jgi:hypothetical protein
MNGKVWEELWWVSYVVLAVWIVNGLLMFYMITQIDSIVNVQLYNFGLEFSKQWADPYWMSTRLMMVFLGLPMALSAAVFIAGLRKFRKKAKTLFTKQKAEPAEATLAEEPETQPEMAEEEEQETVPAEEETETVLEEESQVETEDEEHVTPTEDETALEPAEEPESENEPQLEVIEPEEIQHEEVNPETEEDTVEDAPVANAEVETGISCPQCGRSFNRPMVKLDFNQGTTRLVNVCPVCGHVLGEASGSENAEKTQE